MDFPTPLPFPDQQLTRVRPKLRREFNPDRQALRFAETSTDTSCYIDAMPSGYLPIFIFLAIAILFPTVTIIAARLIRPSAPSVTKLEAYECGIKAASDSRGRYTVRFYIIAILFVIFDVETIFLFPWAVRYKAAGMVRRG